MKENLESEVLLTDSLKLENETKNNELKELNSKLKNIEYDKQSATERVKVLEEEKSKQLDDLIKNSTSSGDTALLKKYKKLKNKRLK